MTATEPADLTFDAALLMGALDAGLAKEAVEPVVRTHGHEPLGLDPVAALQHPLDRSLQVVVADPFRDPAEMFERPDVTVQEHLLALVQIGPGVAATRRRETQNEHRHLDQHPSQVDARSAEVDLGLFAQRVMLRDHHLHQRHLHPAPGLRHVAAHRRFTDVGPMFVSQALPHPAGRVALLARRAAVCLEPSVDHRLPRIQRGRRPLRRCLAFRWHRRGQRLAHIAAMNTKTPRQLPNRQLLALMSFADLLVQLHSRPRGHRPPSTAEHTHRQTPKWGQIR